MYKKIFGSLILLAVINLFNACNDSPTDIGSELLLQDEIEVLKLDSVTDSLYQESKTFKKVYNLGSASQIYLGKAENITSHLLMQFVFALPDSIKNDLLAGNISIIESWVELNKEYSFGNSSSIFDYEVFKVNEPWNSSTFTSDSLPFLSIDNTNLSSSNSAINDSIYSFSLDENLVYDWLLNSADTSKASNDGILVSPTSNTNKIIGFTAYNISATKDPRIKVIINKSGFPNDTLRGYIASDLSIITGDLPNVGAENISIQSGLSAHTKLLIDLSEIPKNIVINSAKLTLMLDSVYTKTGSSFTNAVRVYLFSDSTNFEVNPNYSNTLNRFENTFTGDVTNIIRALINGLDNQGLLIKSLNDLSGVDLYVFKGSNASDYAKRPKLEILYSRKK